jgi:dsDNA-binding SOS-regulon protein
MTERNQEMQQMQQQWTDLFGRMNENLARSMEQSMEAQAAFAESWADAMEDSMPSEDAMTEGFEGMAGAYDVWMDAAEQLFERTADAAEGEDVELGEMRDIWLQSANEAFKQVMSTSAFAAGNGQLFETLMEMQEQTREASTETLAQMGVATTEEMDEVAERLVELERRQHGIEKKLDRILAAVEE